MVTAPSSAADVRLPEWLAEPLAVLSSRRRLVVAVAAGIVFLGAIIAMLFPSALPPRPLVGAAVGVAAALLATAVALALDASDLIVRGARHVTAAGGTVGVRTTRSHDDVAPLLAAVARHAQRPTPMKVALVPASRTAGVPGARGAALAEALARTGRKVLFCDLAHSGTPAAGLSDVVAGARQLSEVVRFETELYLARLAVGSDPEAALKGMPAFAAGLPTDLEVLVAALPPLAEPGALPAAEAFDLVFALVEVDRTERVDLIASLDALDTSSVVSELVLVEPEAPTPPVIAPSEVSRDEPDIGVLDALDDDPIVAEYTFEDDSPVEPVVAPITSGSVWDDDETAPSDATMPAQETAGLDDASDEDAEAEDIEAEDIAAADVADDRVPDDSNVDDVQAAVDEPDDLGASIGEAADDEPGAAQPAAPEPDVPQTDTPPPARSGAHVDDQPSRHDADPDTAPTPEPEPLVDLRERVTVPSSGDPTTEMPVASPAASATSPAATPAASPAAAPAAPSGVSPAASSEAPSAASSEASSRGADVPWLPGSSLASRPQDTDDEVVGADPAAMEAARTSAALYQLAQQVWDREDA